jgi:hypothetical protein
MEIGGLRVQFQDLSGRWILKPVTKVTADRILDPRCTGSVDQRGRKLAVGTKPDG